MPLSIYRYHNKECKEKLLKLGLPVSAHSEYNDCNCMIWIKGMTDNTVMPRQTTHLRDWKAAQALLRSEDSASKDTAVHGPTLEDCITKYLDSRKNQIGKKAHGQFRLVLGRLKEYASQQNKMFIRELDVDLCEDFITYGLVMVENSKATSAAKIRCFLKEAFRRKWITEPLAINIKAPTAVYEPGNPFEKKEVELILTGAEAISGGVSAYAKFPKTFRLLLELMNETGLRCGDAIRYNPLKCEKSDLLWIYTYIPQKTRRTKQPKPADVYLTERLKLAIDNSEWMSRNLPFAYLSVSGKDDKTSYMANEVYERMKSVGAKCGVDDCRPHRLRDTFAVRALLNGLSLDDVSKLLNHSSISVTEKHYAAWVSGRKKRLERLLFQSFIDSQGN